MVDLVRIFFRWLFNSVAAASFVLCVVALALWARSYRVADAIQAGYWNYRPMPSYPTYRCGDMLVLLHRRGSWTVSPASRNCVAGRGFDRVGPGPKHERIVLLQPTDAHWPEQERIAYGYEKIPTGGHLGFQFNVVCASNGIVRAKVARFPDVAFIILALLESEWVILHF